MYYVYQKSYYKTPDTLKHRPEENKSIESSIITKDASTELESIGNKYFVDDEYFGLVRTEDEVMKREEGYKKFAFNLLVSDRIGYYRSIPDTRNKL